MTREEAIEQLQRYLNEVKNDFGWNVALIEALKIAISALSADGGYIKKADTDTLVDELARAISDERCFMSRGRSTASIMQDILDLPTYSFPDSADDNTMEWIFDENETCSRCGYVVEGDHEIEFKFCPNCGRKAVNK